MRRNSVRRILVGMVLGGVLALGVALYITPRKVSAQANPVQLTVVLTTAPQAAFGAPFGYYLRVTNTGIAKETVKTVVTLIAPDSTSYTVGTTSPTISAGAIAEQIKTVTSSTYTSQTGKFTLQVTLQAPSTGPVTATVTDTITVVPVPTSNPNPNVYVTAGGWPDTAGLGTPYYYNTIPSNLSAASMSMRTQVTLINPDLTQVVLSAGTLITVAAGASSVPGSASSYKTIPSSVNTVQYNNQTGQFTLLANVYDKSNNLLATNSHSFTRNANTAIAPSFTDTAMMGTNTSGITADRMLMTMTGCGGFSDFMPGGSGSAVADIDGDGFDDLFVSDMMGMNHLYHNNGNGTFTDQIANSGIMPMAMTGTMMGGPSGASFADIDNDGKPDLLVLYAPQGQLQLFHNNGFNAILGQVTFTDITATSGLSPMGAMPQNFQSATWGDFNNDGYLDLYTAVHADCMATATNQNDHLYQNNGNLTFTDVTSLLGGSTAKQVLGRGLAALFADYRQAGVMDLYVANDIAYSTSSYPNVYWKNNGNGTFTDNSSTTGLNLKVSTMGLAIGDYNRTGLLNIYNTNVATNYLLAPTPSGVYRNASGGYDAHVDRPTIPLSAGGTNNSRTWTPGFYDFNNDGWQDIYVAGDLPPTCLANCVTNQSNILFVSNQDGTFLNLTSTSSLFPAMSMTNTMPGTVFADFDNNGFVDIFQGGMMGPVQLFMNNGKNTGTQNWLEVKLVGQGCTTVNCGYMNKDAVGARLTATVGGANLLRQVVNGGNYQSSSTLTVHFGLGSATQVDTLTIHWADSKAATTTMTAVAANQKITVTEPL